MLESCMKQHGSDRQTWACATKHRPCHQPEHEKIVVQPWLRALKDRSGHPGLGLQAAPGASPWDRAGEGGVLTCRECAQNLPCQQEKASRMSGVRECEKD